MKKPLLLFILITFFTKSYSQNWANDVAPILYNNCTKCHNSNGIAPFSLIGYTNAYTNKDAMQMDVTNHVMPPWPPDPSYRHLAYERILTQTQINTINDWVNAGAPSGDTSQAPADPVYSSIAQITTPDLLLQIPAYTVQAYQGGDQYRCFVLPSGLTAQKFITQMEVLPGNRSIVHHILIYEDTTTTPATKDAADPGPGYTSFGGTGSNASTLIGAWVPGQGLITLPSGMGTLLHKNTNIVLQIHYPVVGAGQTDSTQIRFRLSTAALRNVALSPILNHYPAPIGTLDNGPLLIPANTIKTFSEHYKVTTNYSMLSVGPHCHLIGKVWKVWAVTAIGDTIPLISIPNWNFHWQGGYNFQRIQKIATNTTLYATCLYDNTTANLNNPNNLSPIDVGLGDATTDEMMLVYFAYTPYMAGDETILLDSTLTVNADNYQFKELIKSPQLYEPYPNPVSEGSITAEYYLPENQQTTFRILDLKGSLVREFTSSSHYAGLNKTDVDLARVASGEYIMQMISGNITREKKFVVQ